MGYSGYTQYLCEVGHKNGRDCWDSHVKSCAHCGGKIVWSNSVDTTNGSYCDAPSVWQQMDSEELDALTNEEYQELTTCKGCEWCDKGRIDGYVELEKTQDRIVEKCPCCETIRELEPDRFKIPTDKGRKVH